MIHGTLRKRRRRRRKQPTTCCFLHYSCIQLVCVSCLCVLLCNAASSQCSPRCYSGEEEEHHIQDGRILAGHASDSFADDLGGFDQYNVMRRRSAALRGRGEVTNSSPHGVKDLLFHLLLSYCEGWGAVLSGLLSWAAGGLLLQGALLPRAGELLKSSSSSRPLVASYCVFSRRVIRRSSSSPNSPPIRVGSPTTITSCRERERARNRIYKREKITC